MNSAKTSRGFLILILGALTALSPFSIDMYLPAFPQIAADFHSSVAQVSLSLSSYFVGLSLGQLIYGPMLDRFGRKKPLYAGLLIYILATLGCLLSYDIESLIAVRFLQALGGCAANVAAMTMVRDNFTMRESSKVFSLLVLILGVSPLIAPTVGGYISVHFGWHTVFVILALIAFLQLLVSYIFLPENYAPDKTVSLKPGPIFRNFRAVLKVPQFYTYTFASAIAFAGLFVYVAGSPVIFMEAFKVEAKVYSWIFAFLSVGFIGSSQFNIYLIRKFKNEEIFLGAVIGQVVVTTVFLIGAYNQWLDVTSTVVLLFLLLSCVGLINPNGAALALAPFSKNAGSASALMGFLQMGAGALASMAVGLLGAKELLPVVAIFFVTSMLALAILSVGRRRVPNPVEAAPDPSTLALH